MTSTDNRIAAIEEFRRCMPVREWPELDQAAWSAAFQPGTPFAPGGLAAGWAQARRGMVENGYGRWLTWLALHDLLDATLVPEARVTQERLEAYTADLYVQVRGYSIQARIQQVGDALRVMAPKQDWRWILRAADRIRGETTPAKDKRSRLQSPDRLVDLGIHLMTEAESAPDRSPIQRAITYRDGLVIAFLIYRPVRARTLTAITLGKHLVSTNGCWSLVFGREDTKTMAMDFPFPSELTGYLETYLRVHRPVLLSTRKGRAPAPIQALWVTQDGKAMGRAALAYWIHRNTKQAFGVGLRPHLFRDCAATAIAIYAPEHVLIIKAILGHATMKTSEKHYNQARGLEASRRYHRTIAGLRQPGRDRRNPRDRKPEV